MLHNLMLTISLSSFNTPRQFKVMSHKPSMVLFAKWFDEASSSELNDPNAMFLATVDENGMPNCRVVLMKAYNDESFTFYTNFESAKGNELLSNPNSALCFNWKSLKRQVYVQGTVDVVPDWEADAYFNSRPRKSRIAAWASKQSRPLSSKSYFFRRMARYTLKFKLPPMPDKSKLEIIRLGSEQLPYCSASHCSA